MMSVSDETENDRVWCGDGWLLTVKQRGLPTPDVDPALAGHLSHPVPVDEPVSVCGNNTKLVVEPFDVL